MPGRRAESGAAVLEAAMVFPLFMLTMGMCFAVILLNWGHIFDRHHLGQVAHRCSVIGLQTNFTQSQQVIDNCDVNLTVPFPALTQENVQWTGVVLPTSAAGLQGRQIQARYNQSGLVSTLRSLMAQRTILTAAGFVYNIGAGISYVDRP